MPHHDHSLYSEFPTFHEEIRTLKSTSPAFCLLTQRYDDINRDIAKIESGLAPAADEDLEILKKVRLGLMDEIAERIGRAQV